MSNLNIKKICLELYLLCRKVILSVFFHSYQKPVFDKSKVKKILFIRIDRIGDIVLSLPAIRTVRKFFPESRIDILLRSETKDLLLTEGSINTVIVYPSSNNFLKKLQLIKHLRNQKYDLVIDLLYDYKLKTAIISYLTKATFRIGYEWSGRENFFNFPVKKSNKREHMVDITLNLLKPLGIQEFDKRINIDIDARIVNEVKEFLKNNNILLQKDILVTIHPGGYYPSQRWNKEKFVLLILSLVQKYKNLKILLIGTKNENKILNYIINSTTIHLENRTTVLKVVDMPLNKLSALIKMSNLFIGNNSGPLHIATAVGTPTISFMGPTIPWQWWPYGDAGKNIVLRKEVECSSCNKGKCKNHKCMNLITVEEVLTAVESMLKFIIL